MNNRLLYFITICLVLATGNFISQAQIINTIAGNGNIGYSGDGGPALQASFHLDESICIDPAGYIYVADLLNNRIRVIDPSGIINTYAGNGQPGNNGDGGAAAAARVGQPCGVTYTNSGLYISTLYNYIRLVDPNGIINNVAGDGTSATTGEGGPAVNAEVNLPSCPTHDVAGNLFFRDGPGRIRKINTSGIISTVVGTGVAGYSGDGGPATQAQISTPEGIAIDAAGNMYLSDYDSSRIRKVDASGIISTIAGTGVAGFSGDGGLSTQAQINKPWGIVVDMSGNIYFSDLGNYRIRRIDPFGIITTFAGTGNPSYSGDGGPAILAGMIPAALALDNQGNLLICDDERVRKICMGTSIYITVSPGDTACSNDVVTFTANTTNLGPNPQYQWFKNNQPAGNNSMTYTPVSIANGDIVKCVLTANNAGCNLQPTDTSNSITMVIYDTVTPAITITASPGDSICQEYVISYTATISNGGPNPVYQWYENNIPAGSNSPTHTPNQTNGNVIKCKLTSSAVCASPQSVTSAPHTMSVTAVVTPTVSITANPGTTISQNQSVTFTANVSNASSPQYQWKKNNSSIAGATQQTYTTNTLQNGDVISCRVRGLSICDTAVSVPLEMAVFPVTVSQVTGNSEQLTVWPNPVRERLSLSLSPAKGAGQAPEEGTYYVSISDIAGRELISHTWDGQAEKHISMKGLASGVYMLHVTSNSTGMKLTMKIIKE